MNDKPLRIVKLKMPDKCLSPNARTHWSKKAKATKRDRFLSSLSFKHSFHDELYLRSFRSYNIATIKRVFVFKCNRKRDKDNHESMCKATTDGIVDSRVLSDDDKITWIPTEFIIDKTIIEPYLEYHIYWLDY